VAWDVLVLGCFGARTFWGLGCFEAGMFWSWDVLGLGPFGTGDVLWLGTFWVGTFCRWDVLELGPFVLGRFVLGHFVLGHFVLGHFVGAPKSPIGSIGAECSNRTLSISLSVDNLSTILSLPPSFFIGWWNFFYEDFPFGIVDTNVLV
jgi:hypothetical protein